MTEREERGFGGLLGIGGMNDHDAERASEPQLP
jgi:hypothetical protein